MSDEPSREDSEADWAAVLNGELPMTPADRARAVAPHLEALIKAADVRNTLDLFGLYAGMLDRCLETMSMRELQQALELCYVGGMKAVHAAVTEAIKRRLR